MSLGEWNKTNTGLSHIPLVKQTMLIIPSSADLGTSIMAMKVSFTRLIYVQRKCSYFDRFKHGKTQVYFKIF